MRRYAIFFVLFTAGCEGGATVGAGAPNPVASASTSTASPVPRGSSSPVATASSSPGSGNASPTPSASGATPTATANAASPTPTASAVVSSMPTGSGLTTTSPIKHIVIIIQENRSFDNLFHGFTEPSGAKADYAEYGYDKAGNQIALASAPFEESASVDNGHASFVADYDNGKMDGFYDNNSSSTTPAALNSNNSLAYVPQTEVQPLWDLASQGSLGERFFHGVSGGTFPSHLVFAAGSTTVDGDPTHRIVDNPSGAVWGCADPVTTDTVQIINPDGSKGKTVFNCFSGVSTVATLLDGASHSLHYYSAQVNPPVAGMGGGDTIDGNLEPFQAYKDFYFGPDFTADTSSPETRVLADVPAGTLADVTFVTPDGTNTDHPGVSTATGPAWVASVVNTIGQSKFYPSTAIFVTWDDWGGWFDHVPPPQKYGIYGLSFRIPLIAISPYARHGQLIDTQLEPGSILKFVEETFGLPSLGREDSTANSASAMFDFTQSPAPYKTVSAARGRRWFMNRAASGLAIDDDELGPPHGEFHQHM